VVAAVAIGALAAAVIFVVIPPASPITAELVPVTPLALINGDYYDISDVAFSPNSTTMAAFGANPSDRRLAHIYLWRTGDGSAIHLPGGQNLTNSHYSCACGLAFDPQGIALASGNGSDAVVDMRADGIRQSTPAPYPDPQNSAVQAIAYSPDGREIAEANALGNIHLLLLQGRRWRWANFYYTDTTVSGYYYTDPGNPPDVVAQLLISSIYQIAAYDNAGDVFVWNPTGGSPAHHYRGVQAMAFNPQGTMLAIADGGSVQLASTYSWRTVGLLQEHDATPTGLSFARGGAILAVAYSDDVIRLWDTADFKVVGSIYCPGDCGSVVFSPNGDRLAAFPDYAQARSGDSTADEIHLYAITYST
jgi:WD40 repeat protein